MDEGVLLVSPGASNPKLADDVKDLVLPTYGRDDNKGAYVGHDLQKHFADKKIATINDNSAYGLGMAQEVKKSLNAGGVHEILFENYTAGERDYSWLISKLKQAGIQVVVIGGDHTKNGLIARQISEQKAEHSNCRRQRLGDGRTMENRRKFREGLLMTTAPTRQIPGSQIRG